MILAVLLNTGEKNIDQERGGGPNQGKSKSWTKVVDISTHADVGVRLENG